LRAVRHKWDPTSEAGKSSTHLVYVVSKYLLLTKIWVVVQVRFMPRVTKILRGAKDPLGRAISFVEARRIYLVTT
jgi:hypothetical protein